MDIKKRLERIVHIFFFLQSRSVVTNKELQERFLIGRRTVYRDLKVLEQAGVPIINESGEGFSVMPGFRMQPSKFTQEEVLSLLMAEKMMQQHETEFIKRGFGTALMKIKSSFHVYQKDDLLHLEDKLQISEPFRATAYLPDIIDVLLRSVLKKKIAKISYLKAGAGEMSVRNIEPVGIFHENSSWYVLAFCHYRKEYRHFRLDRIRVIDLSDTQFTMEHPAVDELRKNESEENVNRIVIAVECRFAHFLYWDRQNYGFVREEIKGEEVVMYFNCRQSTGAFARWFMRFADAAKVVEPVSLRKEVKKILKDGMEKMEKR